MLGFLLGMGVTLFLVGVYIVWVLWKVLDGS